MFYIFYLTLDRDFNNNNDNNNNNNRKGRCFLQGYKLTQSFSFTIFIPTQIRKRAKNSQKKPKRPTPNNKTFCFDYQGPKTLHATSLYVWVCD